MNILQWNINGTFHRISELNLMIKKHEPIAIALQETHLKNNQMIKIKNYKSYSKNSDHVRASGGVALLVQEGIKHKPIRLNTHLQAIACQIHTPKEYTFVSIYLPFDIRPSMRELSHLIQQLPAPFIIMGDFNAHNPIWGSLTRDTRGKVIEDLIDHHSLTILNNGENTHFSVAYSSFSSIDLTLTSPSLATHIDWEVENDLHGSDHYPILCIIPSNIQNTTARPKWKHNAANWELYKDDTTFDVNLQDESINELTGYITCKIIEEASKHIPTTTYSPRKHVPWWSTEVKHAIRERKTALNRFKRQPTSQNLIDFKRKRAMAQLIIKRTKTKSWQEFVSQINPNTTAKDMWNCVRKIAGTKRNFQIKQLEVNNTVTTVIPEICNILANTFKKKSETKAIVKHLFPKN